MPPLSATKMALPAPSPCEAFLWRHVLLGLHLSARPRRSTSPPPRATAPTRAETIEVPVAVSRHDRAILRDDDLRSFEPRQVNPLRRAQPDLPSSEGENLRTADRGRATEAEDGRQRFGRDGSSDHPFRHVAGNREASPTDHDALDDQLHTTASSHVPTRGLPFFCRPSAGRPSTFGRNRKAHAERGSPPIGSWHTRLASTVRASRPSATPFPAAPGEDSRANGRPV